MNKGPGKIPYPIFLTRLWEWGCSIGCSWTELLDSCSSSHTDVSFGEHLWLSILALLRNKIKTDNNKRADLREFFSEFFVISLQMSYWHSIKLPAVVVLILPSYLCLRNPLLKWILLKFGLANLPHTITGPNEYKGLKQMRLQLSKGELGTGTTGDKWFEE